jgi:hypothetical protein
MITDNIKLCEEVERQISFYFFGKKDKKVPAGKTSF